MRKPHRRGSFTMRPLYCTFSEEGYFYVELYKNFTGKNFWISAADTPASISVTIPFSKRYSIHLFIQNGWKSSSPRFLENLSLSLKCQKFTYQKMPPVLSISLMESSPGEFHKFPSVYVHRLSMKSNTGIRLENLTKQVYVTLDIFHAFMQNKTIETSLEAWLMLLTTRDLSRIEELICKFPDFSDIYLEIFELRTRPEELIHMYSNVFLEADRYCNG